jgi:hypothetical protein
MRTSRTKYLTALLASAALSYGALLSPNADAATTRYYHGAGCSSSSLSSLAFSSDGELGNTSASTVKLFCPINYGDYNPSTTNGATVDGYQHNYSGCLLGDIALVACETNFDGSGGSCGTSNFAGACGNNFNTAIDTSAWVAAGTDYYYVEVDLAAPIAGSDDVLYGIKVTGT